MLEALIKDFIKVHKPDYLKIQPYIAFIRAAYALGVLDGKQSKTHAKRVRRSDGVTYESMTEAAEKNLTHNWNISKAVKYGFKSVGYTWELI